MSRIRRFLTRYGEPVATNTVVVLPILFGVPYSAAVGPALGIVVGSISKVRQIRAEALIDDVLKFVGIHATELVKRIEADDDLAELLRKAVLAAIEIEDRNHIQALAKMVAEGISSPSVDDSMKYLIGVLTQLQPIHISVLLSISDVDFPPESGFSLTDQMGLTEGIAQSVAADLIRLGLAESLGMSFTGLHTAVRVSKLGREIIGRLRESGSTRN